MFENIFKNSQEHPTDAEIIADLESKEADLQKDAVSFFENMGPEKVRSKSASLLLASVLSFNALSAYAGEQGADKVALPDMGEENIVQMAQKSTEKNSVAPFDWSKIAKTIEISAGITVENTKKYNTENIDSRDWRAIENSSFYGDFKNQYWEVSPAPGERHFESYEGQAEKAFVTAARGSSSAQEFFDNLALQSNEFKDERQKIIALQKLGERLGYVYDYDMEKADTHVTLSEDAIFQALKDPLHYTAGICGNIHTFIMKAAQSMGMEAFMQSGSSEWGGKHVWVGLVAEKDNKKEIIFLDYGTAIPTGTLNYKDALGVAERHHREVAVFNNYVGDEHGVLFPVDSRATEVLKRAAGIEDPTIGLERNLERGVMETGESKFEVKISPETKEIKLGSNTIGLTFFNFQDAYQNSYQSLKEVNAWRGNVGVYGEKGGIGASATVINMSIKDLEKRAWWEDKKESSVSEVITSLFASYIDNKQFTKEEYGQFKMNWGATLSAAMNAPLGDREEGSKENYVGGEMLGAVGARLIYLDPNNVGKFYIDASQEHRLSINDFQEQKIFIKKVSDKIKIGAEVQVFEANILNLEVGAKKSDWGDTLSLKSSVSDGDSKISFTYEKSKSDYERFVPSSKKAEIEAVGQFGPKWEISIIASDKNEHYKGGDAFNGGNNDILNLGIKAKMLLW
ncbi:MAG: hypothetical protein WC791_03900 [Candidatus Paceibacterota bacterium]|jgi:hypothetical protein